MDLEVAAYCGQVGFVEFVLGDAGQEVGFAGTGVADEDHFHQQVLAARLHGIIMGWGI